MDHSIFKDVTMMKLNICIFSFTFMLSGSVTLTTNYENYLQAHGAYTAGDYARATTLLSTLPANSFAILYNLGWAQYKQRNYYEALLAFKRASHRASGALRIQADRMYHQMQEALGIADTHKKYFREAQYFLWFVPTIVLQLMLLILCLGSVWCLYRCSVRMSTSLCALTLLAGGLVYVRYIEDTKAIALIKQPHATLHSGPDHSYASHDTLTRGTEVQIDAREQNWCRVVAHATIGWIHTTELDIVT